MDSQKNNSPVDNSLKTMWVLLSALGLLIIVGTAGIFFFSPDKNTEELKPFLAATAPVPEKTETFDPIELTRDNNELPGLLEKPDDVIEVELLDTDVKESVEKPVKETISAPAAVVTKTPIVKAAEPQYKNVVVDVFWIQVGSYSSLTKAESVSTALKSRGLSSTIQTKNVNGNAVFRVRIGAFNTKEEADKFSIQVKSLKGYEESFVIQSSLSKKVPVNS